MNFGVHLAVLRNTSTPKLTLRTPSPPPPPHANPAAARCNLSSVREGTRIKKMMISSVLKFPLGNVSITKLISERYLATL